MCAGCLGVAVCPIPLRLRSNCLKVIAIQPRTVFLSRCHHDDAVVLTYGISDGTGDSSRATCTEPNLPSRRGWSPHAWIRSFRHSLEYWQPLALVLLNTGGKRTEIYRGCNCSKCNSFKDTRLRTTPALRLGQAKRAVTGKQKTLPGLLCTQDATSMLLYRTRACLHRSCYS